MFSSRKSCAARFGPSPGTRRIASTLSGISASSSSSIGSVPVSTRATIFSARSLPIPSMSVSDRSGSATMSAADSGRSWIVRAALR